jgi:hypothetical protein
MQPEDVSAVRAGDQVQLKVRAHARYSFGKGIRIRGREYAADLDFTGEAVGDLDVGSVVPIEFPSHVTERFALVDQMTLQPGQLALNLRRRDGACADRQLARAEVDGGLLILAQLDIRQLGRGEFDLPFLDRDSGSATVREADVEDGCDIDDVEAIANGNNEPPLRIGQHVEVDFTLQNPNIECRAVAPNFELGVGIQRDDRPVSQRQRPPLSDAGRVILYSRSVAYEQ